jgi:hypothetical protein
MGHLAIGYYSIAKSPALGQVGKVIVASVQQIAPRDFEPVTNMSVSY